MSKRPSSNRLFIMLGSVISLLLVCVLALMLAFGERPDAMALVVAVVLFSVAYSTWRLRRTDLGSRAALQRRRAGQCATCGYDLTGNTSGTCPECGRLTRPSR